MTHIYGTPGATPPQQPQQQEQEPRDQKQIEKICASLRRADTETAQSLWEIYVKESIPCCLVRS